MTLVVASVEFPGGNVLNFRAFPSPPYVLEFVINFHGAGEVSGEIAYRVRKRDDVIYQTRPRPFSHPGIEGEKLFQHNDRIELAFPSQGAYHLDLLFDGALLHSFAFSVFDNSSRADLEREILFYLRRKRGTRSVLEITRGVFNPSLLNKANIREISGQVYFALLRMSEVTNTNPLPQGTLEDKLNGSRWKLKE
jgi:hypothetical protein